MGYIKDEEILFIGGKIFELLKILTHLIPVNIISLWCFVILHREAF